MDLRIAVITVVALCSSIQAGMVPHLSHAMRKCAFGSLRPGQTQTGLLSYSSYMRLEISAIESRDIILSKQRTTKALIRLRGCAS